MNSGEVEGPKMKARMCRERGREDDLRRRDEAVNGVGGENGSGEERGPGDGREGEGGDGREEGGAEGNVERGWYRAEDVQKVAREAEGKETQRRKR